LIEAADVRLTEEEIKRLEEAADAANVQIMGKDLFRPFVLKERKGKNAKEASRDYFNKHRGSKLARSGYWSRDYKYALAVIGMIQPNNLIDIGCGPGAFLTQVEKHYPHPQKAVNEMYRILKPGGYLLINDMDCVTPIRAMANYVFPRLKAGDVKMYNRHEILDMVRKAGFKKVKYRKISPFTFQCIAKKG